MPGFMSSDGGELVAGLNPSSVAQALLVDSSGNLKVTGSFSATVNTPTSSTGTITSVNAAASSTQLLASNSSRKAAYFFNDSGATLYLALAGSASTTAYTVQMPANSFFELPTSPVYTGAVFGIWSSATGAVRITELS
jgi:hypothetical protein